MKLDEISRPGSDDDTRTCYLNNFICTYESNRVIITNGIKFSIVNTNGKSCIEYIKNINSVIHVIATHNKVRGIYRIVKNKLEYIYSSHPCNCVKVFENNDAEIDNEYFNRETIMSKC